MSRLAADVAALQRRACPAIEVDGALVQVTIEAAEDTRRVLLACDEDAYPNSSIMVICDEAEDVAAACNLELEGSPAIDLHTALLLVCRRFGASTAWSDYLQPDLPPTLGRGLSTTSQKSNHSTFSAGSYEQAGTCQAGDQQCLRSGVAIASASSCTLRGLAAELAAQVHEWFSSPPDLGRDSCEESVIEAMPSKPLNADTLDANLLLFLLSQACEKLNDLDPKQRPGKMAALVSSLQRITSCKNGVKAFVLDPLELHEALRSNGLLRASSSDRDKIIALLSPCRPGANDCMPCGENASNQTRIFTQAKRAQFEKLSPRETAEWILAQAHVRLTYNAAKLAEALVGKGCIEETSEGRLSYKLEGKAREFEEVCISRWFEERFLLAEAAIATDLDVGTFRPPDRTPAKRKSVDVVEGALSLSHRSAPSTSSPSLCTASESVVAKLVPMFPDTPLEELRAVAESCDGNVERAVEAVLLHSVFPVDGEIDGGDTPTRRSNVTNESVTVGVSDRGSELVAQGLNAMIGALGGSNVSMAELTRELEAVNALGQQLGFLDFHIGHLAPRLENATIELQREIDMLQRSREAVAAEKAAAERALASLRTVLLSDKDERALTSGKISVEVHLNEKTSQSLRCVGATLASQHIAGALSHSGPWGHYAAYQFAAMLAREQELHSEFVCFYHSYSYAALVYEVQSALARGLFGLPDDYAPLPRLAMQPFRVYDSMVRMRQACEAGGIDHDPAYQAVGLSLSCSLFAFESEAPPLSCFQQGYSAVSVSFRNLLVKILGSDELAETLTDTIVEIGRVHGLSTYNYGRAMDSDSGQHLSGYMLQIFVHRSIVNDYAYPSEPYGMPIPGSLTGYVDGNSTGADGQARLYFHPEIMLDPTRTRLFHYCARPSQSSLDPNVPGSRGSLVQALRVALEPLLSNMAARERTAERLGLTLTK